MKNFDNLLENNELSEDYKSNLSKLLKDYKKQQNRLEKIIIHSDKQEVKLRLLNNELNDYKNHLEQKVEEEIKREEKEKMLFQQSKLAAMGEMMDAVAHQWKQPINIINMQVDMLGYDYEDGYINKEYIDEFRLKVSNHIKHMTDTLNEFRTFFRPNKEPQIFEVKPMIEKVLLLVKDEFMKNCISINIHEVNNFSLKGIENEFKHLILNIINNSKDAFIDNNIKDRTIDITIIEDENKKNILIKDNAGGIPSHVIEDIFKANVTTKQEGKGTGIGLYMSSQIASKHGGTLSVRNVEDGAEFKFEILKV